jgi:hypothetical protein
MWGNDDPRQAKGKGNNDNIIKNTSNTKKRADVVYSADVVCSDAGTNPRGSKKPRRGEEAGVAVARKADDADRFQPCSQADAAADADLLKLEQELHELEQELKNVDENLYADAVHSSTREARASGTYRARRTARFGGSTKNCGYYSPINSPYLVSFP